MPISFRATGAPFSRARSNNPAAALKPSPVQLAQVLATCQLARGAAREALATSLAAQRRCLEPHPNLIFLEGGAHERLGDRASAETAYLRCLELDGRRFTLWSIGAPIAGGSARPLFT